MGSLITLNDKIFAVGGFDGTNRLRSAEYYNDDENAWVPVANMINPRSNFGVEVIDGQIIAVGGFNGFQTTFNVEAYPVESKINKRIPFENKQNFYKNKSLR